MSHRPPPHTKRTDATQGGGGATCAPQALPLPFPGVTFRGAGRSSFLASGHKGDTGRQAFVTSGRAPWQHHLQMGDTAQNPQAEESITSPPGKIRTRKSLDYQGNTQQREAPTHGKHPAAFLLGTQGCRCESPSPVYSHAALEGQVGWRETECCLRTPRNLQDKEGI